MTKTLCITALGFAAIVGCESSPSATSTPAAAPTAAAAAAPQAAVDSADGSTSPAALTLRDEDFVESPTRRDPFRSFAKVFKARPAETPQREVIMSMTAVDEMRLIGIISGIPDPRAQIVDARGVGYVVRRGDFIGRPEVVQTGGEEGVGVTLNWRVDRIRSGEVVLTRADPTSPDRPAITRVLALRPTEGEASQGAR